MKRIKIYFLALILSFFSLPYVAANEWEAENYIESNRLQHSWADAFFFNRYDFRGDETVLDIGCGDGMLTNRVSSKTSGWVLGIDNSPSMVAHAKSTYQSDQVKFELSSAEDVSFYQKIAASCDLVVSFHCLHWVEDHKAVLDGIMTALKPGGIAFLRFCSDSFDPVQELAYELCKSDKWCGAFDGFVDPIHRFGIEQYRQHLDDHGFVIVELKEVVHSDILKDLAQLRSHVKGWLPHYRFLGDKLGSLFLDELIDEYVLRYSIQADSKIELPDCYLEVVAAKNR